MNSVSLDVTRVASRRKIISRNFPNMASNTNIGSKYTEVQYIDLD